MRLISIAELAILTSRDIRTTTRLVAEGGVVESVHSGKGTLYDSALALQAIYKTGDSAKSRLEDARAQLAELDLAERRGALLSADSVLADLQRRYSAFRGRMLAIPGRIAQQFAPPGKVTQAEEVLTVAIHEALAELAGEEVETSGS